uniref:C2H2-type domain-containing protein n=1 Tax=Panagrolaimus superbus TaxID=310955 RepID=A0A914YKV9_9BILA
MTDEELIDLSQNGAGLSAKMYDQISAEMSRRELSIGVNVSEADNQTQADNYYSDKPAVIDKEEEEKDAIQKSDEEDVYFDATDHCHFNEATPEMPNHQDQDIDRQFDTNPKKYPDFGERKQQTCAKHLTAGNRVLYQKNFDDIFEMIDRESELIADNEHYFEIFSGFLKVYHSNRWLCPYCNKLNCDQWNLFNHIKDVHGQHYIHDGFWCYKCECPLLNKRVLQYHIGFCRKSHWYEKVRGFPCYF